MPTIILPVDAARGPLVQIVIMPSAPRVLALQAANQPIPNPVAGEFLIDTGASHTVVDAALVLPLGLASTGNTPVQTPSTGLTPHVCKQYDIALLLPGPSGASPLLIQAMSVLEADFSTQRISGLLGRDVLARCNLTYVGVAGQCVLSY